MLYLPPRWAHDGVAVGECMTYSIGFRQPGRGELARELLQRLAEDAEDAAGTAVYRDPGQPAVDSPGGIPPEMMSFAREALQAVLDDPVELQCLLGEYLSEPKANVWFEGSSDAGRTARMAGVTLDRRSRMLFDDQHIFINGESYRASGRDAVLMRRLADQRRLSAVEVARASQGARSLISNWLDAGWLHDEQ
jgi:50S ribosomal protein L16 3-hydroxylase